MDREQNIVHTTDTDAIDGSFEIKLSITKHKYLHIIRKKKDTSDKKVAVNNIENVKDHYKKLVKEINDLEEEYQNALK